MYNIFRLDYWAVCFMIQLVVAIIIALASYDNSIDDSENKIFIGILIIYTVLFSFYTIICIIYGIIYLITNFI